MKIPTVAEFAKTWLDYARTKLRKQSAIDSDESILRIQIVPFIGAKTLDKITDEVLCDLQAKWIAGGYTATNASGKTFTVRGTKEAKTINNRLSVMSKMLNRALTLKKITALPCRIELLKTDKDKEAGFYEHEMYERLVEAARQLDPRIYAAILLGGDGGLRRGEIAAMNLTDVDFTRGRFTVRHSVYVGVGANKGVRFESSPKGGKEKSVPCTPRLLDALKAVRHLRGPRLFFTDDGRELTPKLLKIWIQRAERKANLPETGKIHIYRHSFGSHLAMAGVPARTVQALCRHASLQTTMRYMQLSPNATTDGIDMLSTSRAQGGKPVAWKAGGDR